MDHDSEVANGAAQNDTPAIDNLISVGIQTDDIDLETLAFEQRKRRVQNGMNEEDMPSNRRNTTLSTFGTNKSESRRSARPRRSVSMLEDSAEEDFVDDEDHKLDIEAEEEAILEIDEENGAKPRGRKKTGKTTTVANAKAKGKRRGKATVKEEGEEEEDGDEDMKKTKTTGRGKAKGRGKKKNADANEEEDEGEEKKTTKVKRVAKPKVADTAKAKGKKTVTAPQYDPEVVRELAAESPDSFWTFHADSNHGMIDYINEDNPLTTLPVAIEDQAPITGMVLSPDGTMLATFCNMGSCKIWDIENDFKLLRKLRDTNEKNIDEFFVGRFTPEQELLVVGGKLKDRHRWSAEDDDNHIMPCPLKIFDLETGSVIAQLEGHAEEILCVKSVVFKGEHYYISTSQDGYIIKWHVKSDWTTLISSTKMEDGYTCMAFTVSFVPGTGNKYFLAACDENICLFDFEEAHIMQTFPEIYSSYCDCGKFIRWLDADDEYQVGADADANEESIRHAYFVTRGAELCDLEDGTISSTPNTCTLHKLVYPTELGGKFELEELMRYKHPDYYANSWLMKIASNGRYLAAPTIQGQVFIYNLKSGDVTAILKDHEDLEVRDVIFHPYRPLLFTSGDDGRVKVYTYESCRDEEEKAQIMEEYVEAGNADSSEHDGKESGVLRENNIETEEMIAAMKMEEPIDIA
ncbi:uncharacterized protein VTP21DRAFT_7501 [Calcarisporiella thermophila]|uniref:uncharacterized protein n=1 Tax=Calcarisporiella thermophila TaxID=911321 RepID=UPI003744667E